MTAYPDPHDARHTPSSGQTELHGIAEVAAASGLSPDTLRWYEKEGLLPRVPRDSGGRRRYRPADRDLVTLLVGLRAAGMSTSAMKAFVDLMGEGAASHGRRIALLDAARDDLAARRRALEQTERALEAKIRHYEELIAAGRDCDGSPVADADRPAQASRRIDPISSEELS